MTRVEHLQWCKARALAYVASGDLYDAVASMVSDMGKHEGTATQINHATLGLGIFALKSGPEPLRQWIEGF